MGDGSSAEGGLVFGEELVVDIPQHSLQSEEKLADTEGLSDAPAPFTFAGETYYLAPMTLRDRQSMTFRLAGGTGNPPVPVTAPWVYCLGIWSFTENEGYTLVDAAVRDEILAAFGDSLSMNMYAIRNEKSTNYPDFAANYPEMTPYDPDGWPCGTEYVFTEGTAGTWQFVAEGTIGGQHLTTGATFVFEPRKVLTIENPATVEELNKGLASFAAEYPAESGYTCDVYLSDAQLTGVIVIPENLYLVCIYGAENQTPTLLLPCSFAEAYVTFGEETVDSVLEAGEIRFAPAAGGSYTIHAGKDPNAHVHTEVTDAAVAATCTEAGKTEGKHCSVCGEVLAKQKEIPALAHSYTDGKCSVCGAKDPDYVPEPIENPFTDVADTAWYVQPVLWAVQNNVTGGIGEGLFGPNNTCTRGQVVTFLYKVYG